MRELVILFVHALATLARLLGPGGIRSVVAESVLVKQQLLILNRSRQRSPNLRTSDRLVAGLCALLIRPARLSRLSPGDQDTYLFRPRGLDPAKTYRVTFDNRGTTASIDGLRLIQEGIPVRLESNLSSELLLFESQ